MNWMFWKKKNALADEAETAPGNSAVNTEPSESLDIKPANPEASAVEADGLETPAPPGLAARMKLWRSALKRYFRKPPEFRAGEDHAAGLPEGAEGPGDASTLKPDLEAPETEHPGEGLEAAPARSRKRLIITVATGLLVALLVGVAVAYFVYPTEQEPARHDMASPPVRPVNSAPPEKPNSEVEALKKENAELQARIEALEKMQQRSPSPPARRPGGRGADSHPAGGEAVVGGEDPQSTAMSLKEAIEAMNKGSGDYNKKPAK